MTRVHGRQILHTGVIRLMSHYELEETCSELRIDASELSDQDMCDAIVDALEREGSRASEGYEP